MFGSIFPQVKKKVNDIASWDHFTDTDSLAMADDLSLEAQIQASAIKFNYM